MDPESDHFKEWRNLREQFREAVVVLKPRIALKDYTDHVPIPIQQPNLEDSGKKKAREFQNLTKDDDESVANEQNTPRIKRHLSPKGTPFGSDRDRRIVAATNNNTPTPIRFKVIPERRSERDYFVDYRGAYTSLD